MTLPDDLDQVDRDAMLDAVLSLPDQLAAAREATADLRLDLPQVERVLVGGMGGSALAGEFAAAWAEASGRVPVIVHRDYGLPAWVDPDTLVVGVSYSGNTEETRSMFLAAAERGAARVAVTSGGHLARAAEAAGDPVLRVPGGLQPRAAIGHLLARTARVLEDQSLLDAETGLREAAKVTGSLAEELAPREGRDVNAAWQLARDLQGRVPVVYGAGLLAPAARRLAGQVNENGKTLAFHGAIPEMNHNEVVGWGDVEDPERFAAVLLRDPEHEHPQHAARFEAVADILSDRGVDVHTVEAMGENPAARLLTVTLLGDAASVYLALERGVDPTPVATIEGLKERLAETGFAQDLPG